MTTTTSHPPGGAAPGAAPDPVAHTLALLHPWIDFVPAQQRRLGLFIFLALLAHLSAFLFVRIDSTRAQLQHQARTHVTVESPLLAVGAVSDDAFWDRLSDPRLFLLPILPPPRSLPEGPPADLSEIDLALGPGQLPADAPAEIYPLVHASAPSLAEQAEAAMLPPRQSFSYPEAPPVSAATTNWQWDADLAARAPAGMADLPSPVSDTDLTPTELRVSVDPEGTVNDVLLEATCQQPDLDRQAILAARKVRFHPSDAPGLAWGRLTIFWHPTAPPREVVVPTPPTPSTP
jgi:TonB family protein